jgi:hypothetical protein
MLKEKVSKSKSIVVSVFMVMVLFSLYDIITTSNELAMTNLILKKFSIPIIVLATILSGYWVLLTEDFLVDI